MLDVRAQPRRQQSGIHIVTERGGNVQQSWGVFVPSPATQLGYRRLAIRRTEHQKPEVRSQKSEVRVAGQRSEVRQARRAVIEIATYLLAGKNFPAAVLFTAALGINSQK